MIFVREGDIYKVARLTSAQDNLLGIGFAATNVPVQVVEWEYDHESPRLTSSAEVLQQVMKGLNEINGQLGQNYRLSKIYFLPTESAANLVYKFLTMELIKRVDRKEPFTLVKDGRVIVPMHV